MAPGARVFVTGAAYVPLPEDEDALAIGLNRAAKPVDAAWAPGRGERPRRRPGHRTRYSP